MCLWVCSLSPPRSFDGSLPNFVGVCRWTSHLPLRGSFSKRSTGRRVNGSLSLSTILYRRQPHTTQLQRRLLLGKQQSLIRRLLLWRMSTTYVGGPGNCYWGVLFLKRQRADRSTGRRVNGSTGHFHFHYIIYDSRRRQAHATLLQKAHGVNGLTGQWVDGSTGQRVTFTFTILYMIPDDARLTPPCCKKHTAYDDTRLTPHRCKKHTASFARSTGKFPSLTKRTNIKQKLTKRLLSCNHVCTYVEGMRLTTRTLCWIDISPTYMLNL